MYYFIYFYNPYTIGPSVVEAVLLGGLRHHVPVVLQLLISCCTMHLINKLYIIICYVL